MIVEYVPGGNLAGRLLQTPMDEASAMKCLRGIAAGLDYAHSLGIVHRDVKPGNVLLEKDGTPVLADFGLVKLLQGSSVQSMTGVTTGTPAYMAPEQVTGHQVGPPADRYSLATMAYEMLTGSIPFDGEGVLELLYAHVHRDPPPPSSRNPELGGAVDAVIMRGLAKDPAARWASCTEFVDALSGALAKAPVPVAERTVVLAGPVPATMSLAPEVNEARPTTRVARASKAATVAMAMPPAPPHKARRPRRRLLEIGAGVVILLLLLLVGGICASSSQNPTLDLSPNITEPGGTVTVTATHVPANEVGQIVLRSKPVGFPFQAGGNGEVSVVITIPLDAGIGDHTVNLCWGGSCHVQRILRVVAAGTLPSPTPSTNPSPSGSPSAKPSPSPTPRPSANPSPSPTPTRTPNPYIVISPACGKANSSVTVAGFNFTPGQTENINFVQGPTATPVAPGVLVGSNGRFAKIIKIPGTALPGSATIRVTGSNGTFSKAFTVPPLLQQC